MRIDRRLLTLAFGGLFWRTFLLIALLIAVSLAAWFQSFRVIEREPRAQRVALQLVAIVKLTRTALLYSDPDLRRALLQDLESNEGVRVYPRETTDKYKLQPDESLNRLIEHDIRGRLGDDTVIAQSVNDIPGVWISFKIDDDDYWVALDREQLDNVTGLQWVGWGVSALALSLFGAAFITSLVNRPFARLAMSARMVGAGQPPAPLPESGMGVAAETNRSFNQMVRDLEQLEADRALMLAGISHDLRTPLARIRLRLESLPEDETRAGIERDLSEMQRLIELSLDYARSLTPRLEYQEVDLVAFTADLLDLYHEGGAEIEADLPASALTAHLDPTALGRILANLLDNALRYGTRAKLRLRSLAGGFCEFVVEDDGPGIPPEARETVLEPFVRLEPSRNPRTGGTGLGLSIAANLARALQGRLCLESVQPHGLRVVLRLPLRPDATCGGGTVPL
jgi:two-component system osmolarity sensor histidine kinase EnvZ